MKPTGDPIQEALSPAMAAASDKWDAGTCFGCVLVAGAAGLGCAVVATLLAAAWVLILGFGKWVGIL